MSFLGEAVSKLEAGTGEPDASITILSHAGDSSLADVVVKCSAFPQPAPSQSCIALLSRFSRLVAKGAS